MKCVANSQSFKKNGLSKNKVEHSHIHEINLEIHRVQQFDFKEKKKNVQLYFFLQLL